MEGALAARLMKKCYDEIFRGRSFLDDCLSVVHFCLIASSGRDDNADDEANKWLRIDFENSLSISSRTKADKKSLTCLCVFVHLGAQADGSPAPTQSLQECTCPTLVVSHFHRVKSPPKCDAHFRWLTKLTLLILLELIIQSRKSTPSLALPLFN